MRKGKKCKPLRAGRGRKQTTECKARISAAMLGRTFSDASRMRMSTSAIFRVSQNAIKTGLTGLISAQKEVYRNNL